MIVTDGRFTEEYPTIWRDIEIVGQPHARVVNDRPEASVGFVRYLGDFPVRCYPKNAHTTGANNKRFVLIESQSKRKAAYVSIDLMLSVVGWQKSNDITMSAAAIKIILVVKNDVFRAVKFSDFNATCCTQQIVLRIRRTRFWLSWFTRRQRDVRRRDIRFVEKLKPVLQSAHVNHHC